MKINIKTYISALAVISAIALFLSSTASAQYKYEEKYGDGRYNYDVEGFSDDGHVTGNVDTNGKYIDGYITDENGDEKYFEGEFTGHGEIEGYDEDGNFIELEVD